MGRFELPAPRPPDEYSNLAELHPEVGVGLGVGLGVLRSVGVLESAKVILFPQLLILKLPYEHTGNLIQRGNVFLKLAD